MKVSKHEFGNYLCALRENNRLTQRQLAAHLGVTDKAISKWENGETRPRGDMLAQVAHFFGITVDELINCGQAVERGCESKATALSPMRMAEKAEAELPQALPSLIQDSGIVTNNYMCTWVLQGATARKLGIKGSYGSEFREALNHHTLFDTDEYYHPYSREFRKDLIFLLDDGWDVPKDAQSDPEGQKIFGSIDPHEDRFPGYGKSPIERLKRLNAEVKAKGYRGVGLWSCCQQAYEGEYNPDKARAYWEERARWCHEAGVMYWKVDWGKHSDDMAYREMMTQAARKYAPDLLVEHAVCQPPLLFLDKGDFPEKRRTCVEQMMDFSDAVRTYDVIEPFELSATLGRAHEALAAKGKQKYDALGLVNIESEPYIGAALGGAIGVMTYRKDMEVGLAWQKAAPPFGIYDGAYICSDEILTDTCFYDEDASWLRCGGKYFEESAPAIMARNCPLPEVKRCGEYSPFVAASKNPFTGAYAVGAFRRTVDPNRQFVALADVTIKVEQTDALIGAFGVYNTLSVECETVYPEKVRIYAQNLLEKTSFDVTEYVRREGCKLTFNGRDMRLWGNVPKADPALAIRICTKE